MEPNSQIWVYSFAIFFFLRGKLKVKLFNNTQYPHHSLTTTDLYRRVGVSLRRYCQTFISCFFVIFGDVAATVCSLIVIQNYSWKFFICLYLDILKESNIINLQYSVLYLVCTIKFTIILIQTDQSKIYCCRSLISSAKS